MSPADYQLEVLTGNDLTPAQESFINHWNELYFGEVAVSRDLTKAPVHWRLLLSRGETLLSHVALTELLIEVNGQALTAGAIGGLFTPDQLQRKGWANIVMDHAEVFIFDRLNLPMAILFCLPELVPFYARRHWSLIEQPVTLEQKNGVAIWGASVMVLFPDRNPQRHHSIHVPRQKVSRFKRT